MPIAIPWRVIGLVMLVLIGTGSAWRVQDWRYGRQLAEQVRSHTETLNQLAMAGATAQKVEQDKRLALEQKLSTSEHTLFEKLTNAQKDQALLRDRLATSDLRLSVLLNATGSAGGSSVPATTGAGGVVHARIRAELDPAHAQRIVAITDAGDQGLIALKACQAYVREVSR